MRLPRSTLLLWFGVVGAPAAWTAQFLTGFWLTQVGCDPGGDPRLSVDAWTIVATVVAALLAVLAELAAIRTFRETRGARGTGGSEEPPPKGRVHFLAIVGMAITPLFFFIIVMSGVGVVVLQNCHQS
jgi:hypothetical protein